MDKIAQLRFDQASYLSLMALLPLLAFVYWRYLRRRSPAMLLNIPVNEPGLKGPLLSPTDRLLVIRIITLGLLITALAGPRYLLIGKVSDPIAETDMIFALDISKSMLLEDIKPNRLEALKKVLARFSAMRSRDRIGIVVYGGESINWCPLTTNYPLLLRRINTIDEPDLTDGTAIGSGLASAINILKESKVKSKLIILLTDGENNAGTIDPLLAAGFARRLGIKIYTIGIGRTGFAQMPLKGLNGQPYYQEIYVKLNDSSLRKIAKVSGGSYYNATDAGALQNIYEAINKLETKKDKLVNSVSNQPCLPWLLGTALLLLFAERFLKYTFLRTWPA